MKLTPRMKIGVAVTRIADRRNGWMPYLSTALSNLVRIESTEIETLAVSKFGALYYNVAFVESLTVESLAAVLAHEVMHVLFGHFARAEAIGIKWAPGTTVSEELQYQAYLANIAQDATINGELHKVLVADDRGRLTVPMPLPPCAIFPETLQQPEGLIWEDRFRRLQKQTKQSPKGGGKGGGKGNKAGKNKGYGEPSPGVGQCGSCSGHPTPGEPGGERGPADGRSEAELDRVRRQVAAAMKEHVSKHPGSVPVGMQRWAGEMLTPPKIDWREHLAQSVRAAIAYQAGSITHHWRRPSRRQGGLGYGPGRPILPALYAPIPLVGVLLDASASMGEGELRAALSEVAGILRTAGASTLFGTFDAQAYEIKEVRTIDEACVSVVGGGGTDTRPAFAAMAERQPRPDIVIVLTDTFIGHGYPETEPEWCKTIWVGIGKEAKRPCYWGDYVHVDRVDAEVAA